MQRFGEKLHALRLRHGLTLRDLAEQLGYTAHGYVSADQLLRDDLDLVDVQSDSRQE